MCFRSHFCTACLWFTLYFVHTWTQTTPPPKKNKTTIFFNSTGFRRAVTSPSFVDKTLFIKHFIESGESVVISAPRGCGKSTNLDMLRIYLEIPDPLDDRNATSRLFQDKLIASSPFPDHFLAHPVVFMDFGRLNTSSLFAFEDSLWDVILDEVDRFKRYREFYKPVLKCEGGRRNYSRTVEGRFAKLVHNLQVLYRKPIYFFVEHFDSPIASALSNPELEEEEVRKIAALINRLVGVAHDSQSEFPVHSLFMASVSVDKIYDLSSAHPTLRFRRTMDDPELAKFFGFTENEALCLAKKFNRSVDEMRLWYGGRHARSAADTIYCPYSTGRFIRLGEPKGYWGTHYLNWKNESFPSEMAMLGTLGHRLEDSLYTKIQIQPCNITLDDIFALRINLLDVFSENPHILETKLCHIALQLLSEYGVYTTSSSNEIRVPNHEVESELKRLIYSSAYLQERFRTKPEDVSAYVQSLSQTTKNDTKLFEDSLKSIHRLLSHSNVKSKRDMLTVLYYSTMARTYRDYAMFLRQYSEVPLFESGESKYSLLDMMFFSWDRTGIIFELRFEQESAHDALAQILQRQYGRVFEEKRFKHFIIKQKLYVGVHYSSKSNLTTLSYLYNSDKIEDAVSVSLPITVGEIKKRFDNILKSPKPARVFNFSITNK
nr:PREDICTED: uncharacterized protein LOC109030551 isoform X1 [Bemisia tabaci]